MCASWNDKYKPDLIANRLEQIKTIDKKTGKASYSGFEHHDLLAVLCSIARLSEDIPETEKHGIILHSTFSAGERGTITAKSLLKEISILEHEFLRKDKINYIMAALLSIKNNIKIPIYYIDSSLITFSHELPPIFIKNRETLYSKVDHIVEKLPPDYLAVRVFVKARSVNEAWEQALKKLDIIRGIWNFSLNRLTWLSISYGGRPEPINKILLGPFHTLHERNGKLATETFWYEPHFKTSKSPYEFDKKENYNYFLSFTKSIRNKINKCSYKEFISEAIIRYTQALDYPDYDVSFIRLWSVLELLTNTTFKETYEKTIKRTAFIFKDYDFHYQVLNHLREFRNKSVHTGSSDNEDKKTYLYQLKRYVESLLSFHLANKFKFPDLSSVTDFLDLSPSRKLLLKNWKLYKKGVRFLSE